MASALVTGGAGFIGSYVADALVEAGYDVTIFDTHPSPHESRSRFVAGDLCDGAGVENAIRGADIVIHAGSLLGTHETVERPALTVSVNVIGSLNVIEACARWDKDLVCISKPNVWLNPYSITKDSMEKFCFMFANEFAARIAVVKLYNVYGPRQKYHGVRKAIPTWIVDALAGRPIEIFGSGDATMDLIHARDVATGILAIVDNFEACSIKPSLESGTGVCNSFPAFDAQVLEIGSGVEITVNEAVEVLARLLDVDVRVAHLPMRRGEIDGTRLCADGRRMHALTGFRPVIPLEEGLRDAIAYYAARFVQLEALEIE